MGQGPYRYNGFGQLASRTITANPTETIHMVYDQDGNLIFEADSATGEMLREYIWLQGRPVAVIDATADSAIYAMHVDHLDRPVMMTNYAGAIVWQASYLPFGEVRTSSGPASLNYRFPGQWFMLETGLHYNWHRWYDASVGRYSQPDPIGMPDGPSRYVYALNAPLSNVDPDGLARRLDPNSEECKALAQKIANIEAQIAKRTSELRKNPLRLPFDPPYPGAPREESISGHISERYDYQRNLERRQREYDEKCGPPPGPPPAPMSVPPPVIAACIVVGVAAACILAPEVCAALAIGGAAAAAQ